tara:strand:+ start:1957 stop:5094 length:3138 start_codon:yes stop_codon:yes gene_type:complete
MHDEKTLEFLQQLKSLGHYYNDYDYSKVEFENYSTKILIIHKKFNSEHLTTPKYMLKGSKCSRLNVINTLSYNDCLPYVHSLKLTSEKQWIRLRKNDEIPYNIPGTPDKYFKKTGEWKNFPEWLGYGTTDFYSFEKARKLVKDMNLLSVNEWNKKKKNIDIRIPRSPKTTYEKEWTNWGDFLGYVGDGTHLWTKDYILDFISNLKNELNTLDNIELVTIINSNNLARKIKDLGYLEELISSKPGSVNRGEIIRNIIETVEANKEELLDEQEIQIDESVIDYELSESSVEDFINDIESEESNELDELKPIDQLKYFDNKYVIASLDNENVDFLLKNQLKKLWNNYLNGKVIIKDLEKEGGGKNFNQIKKWFFEEHREINKIKLPKDYKFKYEPNDMQKLIAYRLQKEKRYGNWSGTGAGKTLAAIFSGRHLELKNTVIVCNNATVKGWLKSSQEYFNNSNVFIKSDILDSKEKTKYSFNVIDKKSFVLPSNQYNYVILNYETFQLGDGDFIVSEMLKNNKIDYLILDEVQNVKQRSLKKESARRNVINKLVIHSRERNPNLHLTAMSATPVINNLTEPKKLIELITGETHEELEVKDSIVNGIEMYKYLTRFGLRYIPKSLSVNQEIIMSDGEHLVERLIKVPKGSHIDFEKILLETKLESIKKYLKKGVLIYTYLVTDFIKEIGKFVEESGFTYGYYTGEDKSGLNRFLDLKVDILIGSAPVSTGVDGIQEVCDTLIPVVLPWTSSEYQQLLGRVNRQGSKFEQVNVFIPQVNIEMDTKTWSHDKRKLNIIEYKSSLADLAVDGEIPKSLAPSKSTLIEEAKRELKDWIKRIEEGDLITYEREELKIPLNPKVLEYQVKKLGNFSQMNKTWSISNSKTNFDRIKVNPKEWYTYHTLYGKARKEWDEIPYEQIAKKIKVREDWLVADLGCGENLLSKEIKNKVLAFDYIAKEGEEVISCDISNIPLDDNKVDVAVFSLSLMGSNYEEYLKESYRILKPYGNLFIAEPKKKGERILPDLKKHLTRIGFKIVDDYYSSNFLYIDCVKS